MKNLFQEVQEKLIRESYNGIEFRCSFNDLKSVENYFDWRNNLVKRNIAAIILDDMRHIYGRNIFFNQDWV